MKTFRCIFLNNGNRKAVDVVAADARSAVSRVVAQSGGMPFQRVEVEDERGLAYMWQPTGRRPLPQHISQYAA